MAAEIGFLNGRAPEYEELSRLRFTRLVAEEAMRLYQPVSVLPRQVINDDVIGGYKISARSELLILPYVPHRHPEWWQEPEKFRP